MVRSDRVSVTSDDFRKILTDGTFVFDDLGGRGGPGFAGQRDGGDGHDVGHLRIDGEGEAGEPGLVVRIRPERSTRQYPSKRHAYFYQ